MKGKGPIPLVKDRPIFIGRDGRIRTGDPLTPSRTEGGNSGQPNAAAPDSIGVLSNPRPPETTSSRYRLSAICQQSSSRHKVLDRLEVATTRRQRGSRGRDFRE